MKENNIDYAYMQTEANKNISIVILGISLLTVTIIALIIFAKYFEAVLCGVVLLYNIKMLIGFIRNKEELKQGRK